MSSLELLDVTFSYGQNDPILDRARAVFAAGFTGLVGDNGAGKSTLLRLLAGDIAPDAGVIRRAPSSLDVVLVPQLDDEDDDDHEENEGGSPGERRIARIRSALASKPGALLLDEPTNHLDDTARARVLDWLRAYRGVGVVVSHDRAFLDALTTRTARVRDARVRVDDVAVSAALEVWRAEEEGARATRDAARVEVARKHDELRRRREAERGAERMRATSVRMRSRYDSDQRGILAQGKADTASAVLGRRARIGARELDRATHALDDADALVTRKLGRDVAFVAAPGAPSRIAFVDAGPLTIDDGRVLADLPAISIGRGDRVHIAGRNGAGKTTLLHKLVRTGLRVPRERAFFLPQELDADDVPDVHAIARDERGRVFQLAAALGADPHKLIESEEHSPGERKKLALAFALVRGVWALFLDEPTNHLDLDAIARLERALVAFDGALVLVSQDAALVRATTTATITVERATPQPQHAQPRLRNHG